MTASATLDRPRAGQLGTLRIATAGSVDDGKSTLIGRLLHDTKTVFEDQLSAVVKASRRYGDGETNLALLTDGLRAEREQGITIDVAHRYFATPRRSFIVADTPGHAQYTRNMVTGASTADVAIVLVDARHGVVEQTRRHAFIATLLGVKGIVLAVNKMDLIDWDETEFTNIAKEVDEYVRALPTPVAVVPIPLSALLGDNVVDGSQHTPWYDGPPLLQLLEEFDNQPRVEVGPRVHVQRVIRPQGGDLPDFRGYAGVLSGGTLAIGDTVTVQPAGLTTTVRALHRAGRPIESAEIGYALVVELADKVDVSRGDVLVGASSATPAAVGESVEIDVCWMIDQPLTVGSRYWFKHGSRTGRATVTGIDHRHDLATLDKLAADQLGLNDLGHIRLQLSEPIVADRYVDNPDGGRMILIDEATNTTAGAAMVTAISA
ncbi:MAG: sulfate adenylyltransferase subunit 1 [Ilumatobacteraceae bacterium]|nr:sulfate adenylyltransferase subunit 1 [Ilumatobacteraceae bacterium]